MRDLRPSELAAILAELRRRVEEDNRRDLADFCREQTNLARMMAVITNNFAAFAAGLAGRTPKTVEADDFLDDDFKKLRDQLLGDKRKGGVQQDWAPHINDAKAKGLVGPWDNEAGGERE